MSVIKPEDLMKKKNIVKKALKDLSPGVKEAAEKIIEEGSEGEKTSKRCAEKS